MGWQSDKQWSDRYIPAIKGIVGPRLLVEAPLEIDQKQATDLIILRARDKMIAARVRRFGYAEKYPNEFTVRSARDSGAETELSKLINGFGDWMFYGHAADENGDAFCRWMIIDLSSWRAHLIWHQKQIRRSKNSNNDGTHFIAFDATSFMGDPSLLVACSHPEEMRPREYA